MWHIEQIQILEDDVEVEELNRRARGSEADNSVHVSNIASGATRIYVYFLTRTILKTSMSAVIVERAENISLFRTRDQFKKRGTAAPDGSSAPERYLANHFVHPHRADPLLFPSILL